MAQLTPRELQELKKLYQDIDGLTQSQAENMALQVQQIGNARRELDRLKTEYSKLTSDITDSLNIYQKITQEISNQNVGLNETKKGYRGLTSIAEKLQYYQQEITNLSSKEVKKLIEKKNQEVQRLKNSQTLLNDKKAELEREKQIAETREQSFQAEINRLMAKATLDSVEYKRLGRLLSLQDRQNRNIDNLNSKLQDINAAYANNKAIIEGEDEATKNLNRTLDKTLEDTLAIEKAMGLTGALMKGMSKIPFLGDLPGMSGLTAEIEEDIKRINKEREKEGKGPVSKAEALSMTFKKMGPVVKEALSDPLVIVGFLVKQIVDAFKSIDEGAGKLAKDMNMSYSEAVNFRGELSKMATLSADNAINTKRLQESYTAIGQSLGANADMNEKDLITFTKLREQAGYTNEELISIQKLSLVTGKSVEDTTKEFFGGAKALSTQKGLAINVKQLLKETSNVSNAIKLSIGGGAKGLAEAAVKAKEFGINLEQADKIAESLLNFEDSISAELSAELLTGKQLNLETARLAALNGDIGKVAEEINKQIGGSAEFTKMNRIQQEAYAKAVGMSREELANSLVEQEALQKVGVQTAAQAKEKYDTLRKTMTAEEAAAELGDEELARQYEQQSVQERFTQAVEKLKDVFVTIAEGPLGAILGLFAKLIDNAGVLYSIMGLIGTVMTVTIAKSIGTSVIALASMIPKTATLLGLEVGRAAAAVATANALTLGLGAIGIIAGIAATMAIINAITKPKPPGLAKGGTVVGAGSVLVGEQGPEVLSMKPGATVTPLSKVNAASEGNGANMNIDYDKLAAAMSKIQINSTLTVDKQVLANTVNSTNNTTSVQIQ